MSLFTESKIQQLCQELAISTTEDVERLISELKTALVQHIHLAKESLEVQVLTLSILSAKARDAFLEAPGEVLGQRGLPQIVGEGD